MERTAHCYIPHTVKDLQLPALNVLRNPPQDFLKQRILTPDKSCRFNGSMQQPPIG